MLSIDCETNKESVKIDSEDVLQFSRNEPLRHLLVVLVENDEEDGLLSSKLRTLREGNSLVQYQSNSFQKSAGSLLCGFAFAFDRHAKSFTFSCNACSSGRSSGTSLSVLFESITNLFDP